MGIYAATLRSMRRKCKGEDNMSNELILREQTQALAETKRLNYEITIPQSGKKIELQRGIDFDKIPGTKQPSLTKAGCLRIAKEGYGLCIEPIIENAIETLDPFPYFFYRARVNLYTYTPSGEKVIVSSGVGSANSAERRNGSKGAHDAANTALKFAEKRAASDAVINLTGLSNIFVQDMDSEDFTEKGYEKIKEMNKDDAPITGKQLKRLWAIGEDAGLNIEEIKTVIKASGYPSTKDIIQKDYDKIIEAIKEKAKHD